MEVEGAQAAGGGEPDGAKFVPPVGSCDCTVYAADEVSDRSAAQ